MYSVRYILQERPFTPRLHDLMQELKSYRASTEYLSTYTPDSVSIPMCTTRILHSILNWPTQWDVYFTHYTLVTQ